MGGQVENEPSETEATLEDVVGFSPKGSFRKNVRRSWMMYLLAIIIFLGRVVPSEAVQHGEQWDQGDTWANASCILSVVCYCGWCTWTDSYGYHGSMYSHWQDYDERESKGMGKGAGSAPNPAPNLKAWFKSTPRQKNRRLQRAKYRFLRDKAAEGQEQDVKDRVVCTSGVNSVSPTEDRITTVGNESIITNDECNNTLFFSNITEWGPQAKRYFLNESVGEGDAERAASTPRWEAVGMVEHHLPQEKAGEMQSAFAELGYRCTVSGASKSRRTATGTNGGSAIAVPRNRSTTMRNPGQEIMEEGPALCGEGWSVVILHRHGIDISYAAGYFIWGDSKHPTKD